MGVDGNIIVADYIDRLPPETTMEFVFADLFNNVSQLADHLREPVELDDGLALRTNEGSGSSDRTNDDDDSGLQTAMTHRVITVGCLPRVRDLVGLSQEGPAGEEQSLADVPRAVHAFRNTSFPVRNYNINKLDDEVLVHIGDITKGTEEVKAYQHEEPYTGYTRHDLETPISELDDRGHKQLRLVTNAIELGVARAELLASGQADFYDMFGIEPPRKAPHFSLRRLLAM